MSWKHDDLARDLAGHLRATGDRVVWTDMQMGPSGSPRPDVYTLAKSYSKFTPISYEIKISVADFRRDVTAGKWQSYLKYSSGVIFAVPQGLIAKADVPPGCGLIVRTEDGWRNVKGPTLQRIETLPHSAWMKLMIDGIERQAKVIRPRDAHGYRTNDAIRKRYGEELAQALSNRDLAKWNLEQKTDGYQKSLEAARLRHEKDMEQLRTSFANDRQMVDGARAELAVALGLAPGAGIRQIQIAASEAVEKLNRDEEIMRLRRCLELAEAAISRAGKAVAKELAEVPPLAKQQGIANIFGSTS